MQTSASPKRREAIIAAVIIGVLILLLYLSNQPGKTPDGIEIIASDDQYASLMARAEKFSKEAFIKFEHDENLNQEDKDNVSEAVRCFKSLNTFKSNTVTSMFGEGLCYQMLGDMETAEGKYRQALANEPLDQTEGAKATIPEVHYRLSQVRFNAGDYQSAIDEATKAIKAHQDAPQYWTARARPYAQEKRFLESDKDLHRALNIDPEYRPALLLHKLVANELHKNKPLDITE